MVDIQEWTLNEEEGSSKYDRQLYFPWDEVATLRNAAVVRMRSVALSGGEPFQLDRNISRLAVANTTIPVNGPLVERFVGLLEHSELFGNRTFDYRARDFACKTGRLITDIENANTAFEEAHATDADVELARMFGRTTDNLKHQIGKES